MTETARMELFLCCAHFGPVATITLGYIRGAFWQKKNILAFNRFMYLFKTAAALAVLVRKMYMKIKPLILNGASDIYYSL